MLRPSGQRGRRGEIEPPVQTLVHVCEAAKSFVCLVYHVGDGFGDVASCGGWV